MARLEGKKRRRIWLWGAIVTPIVLFVAANLLSNENPPTNRATTSPGAQNPALRSRIYNVPLDQAEDAARRAASAQKTFGRSWRVVYLGRADEPGRTTVDVEVPVLFFTDDFVITLEALDATRTRVDVTSQSRVGNGDFGMNRRHVIQFLENLDEELNG